MVYNGRWVYNGHWQGRSHKVSLWLFLVVILTVSNISAAEILHHDLQVRLQPADGSISVIDDIQFPAGTVSAEFTLRNGLTVKANGVELLPIEPSSNGHRQLYRINRLPPDGKVQLGYAGKIVSVGTDGPFDMPESVLNPEDGVYLDSGSAWLPEFHGHELYTFDLNVVAPANWQVISQGKRSQKSHDDGHSYIFNMPHPQDSIYLIAGPYQRYIKKHEDTDIVVYLYPTGSPAADQSLAETYLETSAEYISLYSNWIGPYPYAKFAVVENRWQTGYGMPSFTLLGSRVMRLPFILYTSLPHEILHNWWGNGVYIDASKGNWSEGLTAYMSDHYSNEQQGKGREYRRKALERYANFAAEQRDFALADFRSRHDEASQAVGYNKSLMLFHMLRQRAGDDAFDKAIQTFWLNYQFSYADFHDLIQLLYTPLGDQPENDQDYRQFIDQWLERKGAPQISLDNVSVSKQPDDYTLSGYTLSIKISQQQPGPAYRMQIPLEVTLNGKTRAYRENIQLTEKSQLHTVKLDQAPVSLTLDPDYDVFRLLHSNERPASLGRLFGAKKQLLVLPANNTAEQTQAWQGLAAAWSGKYNNVEVIYDDDLKNIQKAISDGDAVWLLGWNNKRLQDHQQRFSTAHTGAIESPSSKTYSQTLTGKTATINKQALHADKHAIVLLDTDNTRSPMGFIGADDPAVIASIARKLPHYSSYGALAFELPEVNNIIKHHLPVLKSPMIWKIN
jgi:hypothetical protein